MNSKRKKWELTILKSTCNNCVFVTNTITTVCYFYLHRQLFKFETRNYSGNSVSKDYGDNTSAQVDPNYKACFLFILLLSGTV